MKFKVGDKVLIISNADDGIWNQYIGTIHIITAVINNTISDRKYYLPINPYSEEEESVWSEKELKLVKNLTWKERYEATI